jgi:hypothetical protein
VASGGAPEAPVPVSSRVHPEFFDEVAWSSRGWRRKTVWIFSDASRLRRGVERA